MQYPEPPAVDISIRKKVLHVGSGSYREDRLHKFFQGPAWQEIRLDVDPEVEPDIVASMTDMQGVWDESMDAVWSSHNLEHLYPHEVPLALAEFYRVLKIGGMAFVVVPDLQQVAQYVAAGQLEEPMYQSEAGPISPIDSIFGFRPALARGNHFMAHKTGFTGKTLTQKFEQAGFKDVQVQQATLEIAVIGFRPPAD